MATAASGAADDLPMAAKARIIYVPHMTACAEAAASALAAARGATAARLHAMHTVQSRPVHLKTHAPTARIRQTEKTGSTKRITVSGVKPLSSTTGESKVTETLGCHNSPAFSRCSDIARL